MRGGCTTTCSANLPPPIGCSLRGQLRLAGPACSAVSQPPAQLAPGGMHAGHRCLHRRNSVCGQLRQHCRLCLRPAGGGRRPVLKAGRHAFLQNSSGCVWGYSKWGQKKWGAAYSRVTRVNYDHIAALSCLAPSCPSLSQFPTKRRGDAAAIILLGAAALLPIIGIIGLNAGLPLGGCCNAVRRQQGRGRLGSVD